MDNISTGSSIKELFNTVVDGGYCIGCGVCAALPGSPIKIGLDPYLQLQAKLDDEYVPVEGKDVDVLKVCPFSNSSDNEDVIGSRLFSDHAQYHEKVGYHLSTFAGHVLDGDFRMNGSSGGMGTWIATKLFTMGLIDCVVNIHSRQPTDDDKRLFHYKLSTTIEEVKSSSKSRYYPIELSEVIEEIRTKHGKYLIVGVPCFVKSLRLLAQQDPILNSRIKFCIGLVCGHLKSKGFADMLAWQSGVDPCDLTGIDFRKKLDGYGANQYGVSFTSNTNLGVQHVQSPPVNKMYGTNWGLGFFKYKACDFCDDVVAETADVTIGDAWLPEYVKDSQGTNVVIVRNKLIDEIIKNSIDSKELKMDVITPEQVVTSQKSGFEHRREGLQYRLFLTDEAKVWRPKKRVKAQNFENLKFQTKQKLRIQLARESHVAFKEARASGTFNEFVQAMNPTVKKYQALYKMSISQKLAKLITRILRKLKKI